MSGCRLAIILMKTNMAFFNNPSPWLKYTSALCLYLRVALTKTYKTTLLSMFNWDMWAIRILPNLVMIDHSVDAVKSWTQKQTCLPTPELPYIWLSLSCSKKLQRHAYCQVYVGDINCFFWPWTIWVFLSVFINSSASLQNINHGEIKGKLGFSFKCMMKLWIVCRYPKFCIYCLETHAPDPASSLEVLSNCWLTILVWPLFLLIMPNYSLLSCSVWCKGSGPIFC